MTDHNQKMIDTINNYVITNRLAQLEKNTAKKAIKVLSTRAQQMLLLQQTM